MHRLWRTVVVLFLVGASLTATQQAACAMCSCAAWTEAEALEAADYAFSGVVTALDKPFMPGGDVHVTLLVERAVKGDLAPNDKITLTTASDGAACGYDFKLGFRYQVYTHGTSTGLCSGNREIGAAPEVPLDPGFPWGWVAVGGGAIVVGMLAFVILRRRTQLSA